MSDTLALARRSVACKRWRWMPGMLAIVGVERQRVLSDKLPAYGDWIPDLADAATLGCLLALVREAVGDPCAHIVCVRDLDGDFWFVARTNWRTTREQNITGRYHRSEAEALVAALEAANV